MSELLSLPGEVLLKNSLIAKADSLFWANGFTTPTVITFFRLDYNSYIIHNGKAVGMAGLKT
jgi:hypothetical protein